MKKKVISTAVSYNSVKEWFQKAHKLASSQGKSDSAALWRDGLEHLESLKKQRDDLLAALEDMTLIVGTIKTTDFSKRISQRYDAALAVIAKTTSQQKESVE